MALRAPALLAAALAALAAAGCGGSSPKPYTAAATAPCLRGKGFANVTTASAKVGFVAAFANNGGLRATSPSGNTVTIAFAADESAVSGTEKSFRANATGVYKRHIQDVMSSQGNAVIVWTTTPSQGELGTVTSCLQT